MVGGTLIDEGDELRLEPSGRTVRVRSVQVHDRAVARADAGQRVAVSLPGVERHEVGRGDVLITPGAFRPSFRLDVALDGAGRPARARPAPPRHRRDGRARGPRRPAVRAAAPGAQPVVAARGDRFVLRTETTVGGGVVLDPAPARHSDLARFEAAERGELVIHAPILVDGEWQLAARSGSTSSTPSSSARSTRLTRLTPASPPLPPSPG